MGRSKCVCADDQAQQHPGKVSRAREGGERWNGADGKQGMDGSMNCPAQEQRLFLDSAFGPDPNPLLPWPSQPQSGLLEIRSADPSSSIGLPG